jgi:hypothetical protein
VNSVDFIPLPTTAIRVSITSSTEAGRLRIMIFPEQNVSFAFAGPTSRSPPTFRVMRILQSAESSFAQCSTLSTAKSQSSFENPISSPLSSMPRSKSASPCPSSNLEWIYSVNWFILAFKVSDLSRRTCFRRIAFDSSASSSWSRMSSSSCSS